MRIRVLGSAAGGGFPQWNCGCRNCAGVRSASVGTTSRTQESIAVSADGDQWILVNCSPDVRQQIESAPMLHPRAQRHTPIGAVVLTNGDLDHCLGLLSLRESQPLALYATEAVYRGLVQYNVLFRTLERFEGQLVYRRLVLDQEVALAGPDGRHAGLCVTAFASPGKVPVHLESVVFPSPEDNVGLILNDTRSGSRCAYIPSASSSPTVSGYVRDATSLFFDGTFYSSDELIRLGVSTRRAEDMAHLPVGGADGSVEALKQLRCRRIYIHVNNTNPILDAGSEERRFVCDAGWEVAYDGMEVEA